MTATGTIIVSGIAGPEPLAGADCNPNLFVASCQNNTPSAAVGKMMTDAGVKRAFFIAQNYITGKEDVAGAKSYNKGKVVGEAYVPIAQVDYAAEIASIRAATPDAVYNPVFYAAFVHDSIMALDGTVFRAHRDSFYHSCHMAP